MEPVRKLLRVYEVRLHATANIIRTDFLEEEIRLLAGASRRDVCLIRECAVIQIISFAIHRHKLGYINNAQCNTEFTNYRCSLLAGYEEGKCV